MPRPSVSQWISLKPTQRHFPFPTGRFTPCFPGTSSGISPLRALKDWFRALRPGGELFYADGNHYRYLEDDAFARLHQTEAVPYGHSEKFMLGVDTSPMERIAGGLPLTHQDRPGWDVEALLECGFIDVTVCEPVLVKVTDPMTGKESALIRDFMVLAKKPV